MTHSPSLHAAAAAVLGMAALRLTASGEARAAGTGCTG